MKRKSVARRHNIPPANERIVRSPADREPVPVRSIPEREIRQSENPRGVTQQPQPPATRNENRETGQQGPPLHYTTPESGRPAQNENQHQIDTRPMKPVANPAPVRQPQLRQETKPAPAVLPRVTVPAERQPEARPQQPQPPTTRTRPEAPSTTIRPGALKKPAQVQVEKISKPTKGKPAVTKQRGTNVLTGADRRQDEQPNAAAERPAHSQNPRRD